MNDKRKKKTVQKHRKAVPQVPEEWLYLAPEGVTLRFLYDQMKEERRWRAEYWEEAGVLEIRIPEAGSVDLESIETEEEALRAYMEAQKAASVCEVTIMPEYFTQAQSVMRYITEHAGGVFCGDTDDFLPEIRKDSVKGE